MNKREFVLGSGGALVAGGTWAATGPAAANDASAPAPGSLGHWQGRVGERFAVFGEMQPQHLVLQRVDPRPGEAGTLQFSLVFHATGAPLAAGAQVLQAGNGSGMALFLDRAGADATGARLMRADFCQLA